jgi:hypothetical protein
LIPLLRRIFLLATLTVWGLVLPAAASAEQFIVAESPGHQNHLDSYVITLSDPSDIAHARDLIARGPAAGEMIVVAPIAPGFDGINRNYLAPGAPAWSWHVVGEASFTDFEIELYDGWPSEVESDVNGWMRNTGGHIAFWNYTIVAELGAIGAVAEPSSLTLVSFGIAGMTAYRWLKGRHRRHRLDYAIVARSGGNLG